MVYPSATERLSGSSAQTSGHMLFILDRGFFKCMPYKKVMGVYYIFVYILDATVWGHDRQTDE